MSTRKKKTEPEGLEIESTMKSIEKLLDKLEKNETSLGESLQAFEEGIHLIRKAQDTLATAEQQIELLLEKNGEPREKDFLFDEDDS